MESPFAHLLCTNSPLSNTESREIREYLTKPLAEVSRLKHEILRMQAIIDDLQSEHDKLSEHVETHKALLAPARRLPPEVVQNIFIACLPSTRNAAMSATEAPILLGRVCSSWRRIAASTAQLWSSLHIVIPHPSCYPWDPYMVNWCARSEAAIAWLGRAGVLPLSISVASPRQYLGYAGDNGSIISRLMNTLIPFSHRWKNVDFRLPSSIIQHILAIPKHNIPMLATIKIHEMNSPLRSQFQGDHAHLSFPWAQLTQLALNDDYGHSAMNPSAAIQLLRRCSNLRGCSLKISPPRPGAFTLSLEPHTLPIALPVLYSLALTDSPGGDLTFLFESLVLPVLCDLRIQGCRIAQPQHTPLLSFLSVPQYSLRSLTLDRVSISEDALIECLQVAHFLTSLTIVDFADREVMPYGDPVLTDKVLACLTPTQESSEDCLCPRLELVKFTECKAFSEWVLLKFIQSRVTSPLGEVAPLKYLTVELYREPGLDIYPQIRSLSTLGSIIHLIYVPPPQAHQQLLPFSPWLGLSHPL